MGNWGEIAHYNWLVLSDEQMSKGCPFSLLNDEQMSNKVRVEHQPDNPTYRGYRAVGCQFFGA